MALYLISNIHFLNFYQATKAKKYWAKALSFYSFIPVLKHRAIHQIIFSIFFFTSSIFFITSQLSTSTVKAKPALKFWFGF